MTLPAEGCGKCGLCCKLLPVASLDKPANSWCRHASPTDVKGCCQIYQARPRICRSFLCGWLISQRTRTPLSPDLRPDHSHVIMTGSQDGKILRLHVDPKYPDAWKQPAIAAVIKRALEAGDKVHIIVANRGFEITPGNGNPS